MLLKDIFLFSFFHISDRHGTAAKMDHIALCVALPRRSQTVQSAPLHPSRQTDPGSRSHPRTSAHPRSSDRPYTRRTDNRKTSGSLLDFHTRNPESAGLLSLAAPQKTG